MRRLAAALLLGLFLAQGAVLAWRTGVTYDEPPYLASGFLYWTQGLGFLIRESPPLIDYLRGIPVLLLRPSAARAPGPQDITVSPHGYGQLFLFNNRVPARRLLLAGRGVSLGLALLLAIALWRWGQAMAGPATALAALFFYVFEANLLAHSSLATKDVGVTAFAVAALACWASYLSRRLRRWALAAGFFLGAAVASKTTGLGRWPAMGAALIWRRWRREGLPGGFKEDLIALAAVTAVAAAVVLATYGPSEIHRFFDMMAYYRRFMRSPMHTYLFGKAYFQSHPLYFPAVILVKTSVPLLLLALYALFSRRLPRKYPDHWPVLASGVFVLLGFALLVKHQVGVRHLLILQALFCLAAGVAAIRLWRDGRKKLVAAACLWHALSLAKVFPHPIAYFNELAGGASNGYRLLGDSNLDWGQGLPELEAFIKEQPGGLLLSYFGTDCPREYGLEFQDAFSTPGLCPGSPSLLPLDVKREWLAVSATKWQGFYENGPPAWGWLRRRKPHALLGYSIFVYDITSDAQAHESLAAMYAEAGQPQAARRELARARLLRQKEPA